MVSFDHDDVIFLLNKWDSIIEEEKKDEFFKSAKKNISRIWEAVKPQRILKLSMHKVLTIDLSLCIYLFWYECVWYKSLLIMIKKKNSTLHLKTFVNCSFISVQVAQLRLEIWKWWYILIMLLVVFVFFLRKIKIKLSFIHSYKRPTGLHGHQSTMLYTQNCGGLFHLYLNKFHSW